ncbi:MAG: hypothetical protein ACK5OX_02545 [Desertimonas sp.]
MKRSFWFVGGVATGIAGVNYTKRKVATAAQQLAPVQAARRASDGVRRLSDAVRAGRETSRIRQRELHAERDGDVIRLVDHLQPGDEVLIDGTPIETGRVILMRRRQSGP